MNTTPALQPLLIDGEWVAATAPAGSFHAFAPARAQALDAEAWPVSSWADLEAMLAAGARAAAAMATLPEERIAVFLDSYADAIAAEADALVASAHEETGLPASPRLRDVELPRTTRQLRLAAAAARDGSWRRPTIDSAANLRSLHAPLGGPVLVLGPNNFPFAFNAIAGGDFAAAIAAGNPVIAKAHPAHPRTSALLARLAATAAARAGLPTGAVQMFFHVDAATGLRLVADPRVAALAFTGSRPAGMALKAAADRIGKPAYLEMSSVNPVFVLAGALRERGSAIAAELQASCALGAGQFCTRPGLAVLAGGVDADEFVAQMQRLTAAAPAGVLLTPRSAPALVEAITGLCAAGAELLAGGEGAADAPGFRFPPTLLRVSAAQFLAQPARLQHEAFVLVCLLVIADSSAQVLQVAATLEGNLTGAIYSDTSGSDDTDAAALTALLRPRVGRLLNDRMPTGVAVSAAMNHGGPFPATGHPGFTAVGIPASLLRFTALHCFDGVREPRLPPALRDRNPDGALLRWIDGEATTRDVGGAP